MSDFPQFPLDPNAAPTDTPPKRKSSRKKPPGAAKAAEPAQEKVVAPKPEKAPRKPKAAKLARKAGKTPKAFKLDLGTAMAIASNLSVDEVSYVTRLVDMLQPLAKKSRARVVEALGKLFI